MLRDVVGHEGPRALLQASIVRDRIAHAYLFYGEEGIGKRLVAVRFAQSLNCDTGWNKEAPDACLACRSCRQIEAHTHPDFRLIEPDQEQTNPQIKIEQIRDLEQQIVYRPLIGRFKIFIIDDADRMTLGAANAFLKTLEEPPPHTVFILITSRPFGLPTTIRSRCQSLRFVPPPLTQVEAALILKREVPPSDARLLAMITHARIGHALRTDLKTIRARHEEFRTLFSRTALESVATLLTTVEALHKADRVPEALEWISQWIRDLLLIRTGADRDLLLNLDRLHELKETAQSIQPEVLLDLLTELEQIERAVMRNINLQLALETFLLRIREAVYHLPAAAAGLPPFGGKKS